jgi:hypothetical protein
VLSRLASLSPYITANSIIIIIIMGRYHRDITIWIMGVALGSLMTTQLLAGCSYGATNNKRDDAFAWGPPRHDFGETEPRGTITSAAVMKSNLPVLDVPPIVKTTPKTILLPEGHFGLSNQMACLNLAAILAKQYNRTLVVPANGCAGNRVHDLFPIPFERVYDVTPSSSRIPFRIDESGAQVGTKTQARQLPSQCQDHKIEFDTKHIYNPTLGRDPYPTAECVTLICTWTRLRFVAPPDIFPHVDQVFFPYNTIYRQAALNVIGSIQKQAKFTPTGRLLTLHVRRGDRSTVPLFDCETSLGHLYPYLSVDKGERLPVVCTNSKSKNRESPDFWDNHALSWDKFFEHMADPQCHENGFPICANDFEAIFVATNDPEWVRSMFAKKEGVDTKMPPAFLLGDFQSLLAPILLPETKALERPQESAEMLLIEEMLLVLSDWFVPSFESSITQQVLRLRIDEQHKEWDKHLLDTYYDFRARAHKKRWPDAYQ